MKRIFKKATLIIFSCVLLLVIIYAFARAIPALKAVTEFALLIWYLFMSA